MSKVLVYNIDPDYLKRAGGLLVSKINELMEFSNVDAIATYLAMDDFGVLQLDCLGLNDEQIKRATNLTNMFLNEFNIEYDLKESLLN